MEDFLVKLDEALPKWMRRYKPANPPDNDYDDDELDDDDIPTRHGHHHHSNTGSMTSGYTETGPANEAQMKLNEFIRMWNSQKLDERQ